MTDNVWVVMHGYVGGRSAIAEIMEDGDFGHFIHFVLWRFHRRIEESCNSRYLGAESIELLPNGSHHFSGDGEWYSLERRSVTRRPA